MSNKTKSENNNPFGSKTSSQQRVPLDQMEDEILTERVTKESSDEDNKLKALNDLLKQGKSAFQMKQEDEDEFEMFIHKLNGRTSNT